MQPVVRTSRFPYSVTVTHLGVEIARAGATIFCKLDQSVAARGVGLTLRPTTLFIFGNPAAGTHVMDAMPLAALDLPLKLLVWEDNAATRIAFLPARALGERYDIAAMTALLDAMDDQLQRIVATVSVEDSAPPLFHQYDC
jgi:uncharacterized protein (DUF302 family)